MATRVEERAASEHQEVMGVTEADGGDCGQQHCPSARRAVDRARRCLEHQSIAQVVTGEAEVQPVLDRSMSLMARRRGSARAFPMLKLLQRALACAHDRAMPRIGSVNHRLRLEGAPPVLVVDE